MNCKPGDLAVNVGGATRFLGEVYRVLRRYDGGNYSHFGPAWLVDHNGKEWHASDSILRPIRPDESPEESTEAMKRLHDTRKEQTA